MHPQVPQLCLPGPIRPFQAGFAWGLLFPWLAHYSPGVPRGCHSLGPTPEQGVSLCSPLMQTHFALVVVHLVTRMKPGTRACDITRP